MKLSFIPPISLHGLTSEKFGPHLVHAADLDLTNWCMQQDGTSPIGLNLLQTTPLRIHSPHFKLSLFTQPLIQ